MSYTYTHNNLSSAAAFGGLALGIAISWTSPALMRLNEEICLPDDCDITGVTAEMSSWMAASVSLGAAASGPITGWFSAK